MNTRDREVFQACAMARLGLVSIYDELSAGLAMASKDDPAMEDKLDAIRVSFIELVGVLMAVISVNFGATEDDIQKAIEKARETHKARTEDSLH